MCFSYFETETNAFCFVGFGCFFLDPLEHLIKSGPGRLLDALGFEIVLKSYGGARKTTMEIKKIDLGRF